jgi:hypothetical protein
LNFLQRIVRIEYLLWTGQNKAEAFVEELLNEIDGPHQDFISW